MASLADETLQRAVSAMRAGQAEAAERLFKQTLQSAPNHLGALNLFGFFLTSHGRFDEAERHIRLALKAGPASDASLYNYGLVLKALKRPAEALEKLSQALQINSSVAETWNSRGTVFNDLKRYREAMVDFDRAIAINANFADPFVNKGNALTELKSYGDALALYDRALTLNSNLPAAWLGRAKVLFEFKQYDNALAACDRALALKPDLAEAWLGRGNVFYEAGQYDDALAAYDRTVAMKGDLAFGWLGRGNVLADTKRYADALVAYDRALASDSDLDYALGARILSKLMICDWADLDAEIAELLSKLRDGKLPSAPFMLLATTASAADQLQCVRRHLEDRPIFPPLWRGHAYHHDRIRIAYLSADFYEHATASLLTGLFERHDRSRFDVTGLSFGSHQNSPLRQRIEGAFERFVDVRDKSEREIAEFVRTLEIDIAVDLMGFTKNNRLSVLARRPAPIQVNYLGYIGTMGADFIDYVIADEIALPFDQQPFFAEKIVHLPGCFLVTDDRQEIAPHTPSREEAGLPPHGFVFCSFNNSYKLAKSVFEAWMRLLGAVAGSVLWLAESNSDMAVNLRHEARRCGIAPERLVFAPRVPLPQHLARQRLAGLFLDTVPYNAGATGVAALWSGVPMLAMRGQTFVGRMAASMLHSIGAPELVAQSLQEYEALALKLAHDPDLLSGIRRKLQGNLRAAPLFDTERFRRQLEQAYGTMVDIQRKGRGPRSFSVESA
jgi:predicted O-linked N-acetylglucosamine transferase (SPINDLY family)